MKRYHGTQSYNLLMFQRSSMKYALLALATLALVPGCGGCKKNKPVKKETKDKMMKKPGMNKQVAMKDMK